MGTSVTLGGDRLGSGNKNKQYLHGYERSNHNLSSTWKSTMASGVLVPFMSKVLLPGDTFDIKLDADVMTHPTVGPLFGSYKLQLDVFKCPIRLYQGQLHNNKLNIGMEMDKIKLPQIHLTTNNLDFRESSTIPIDLQQINPSSLLRYLGISGVGQKTGTGEVTRQFNAIPLLAYWDIFKNYYANKQETEACVIDYSTTIIGSINTVEVRRTGTGVLPIPTQLQTGDRIWINGSNLTDENINIKISNTNTGGTNTNFQEVVQAIGHMGEWRFGEIKATFIGKYITEASVVNNLPVDGQPQITKFPLENLDTMRESILNAVRQTTPYIIGATSIEPYGCNMKKIGGSIYSRSYMPMQGLALKTYQSDLYNNWLKTEWIDGTNGISALTAIDVSSGLLKLDTLNLAQKVYNMLNRVAVSGGSYGDYIEAVYGESGYNVLESPIYEGGMSKEIIFQEVVSNSATGEQPLGSLAGRGRVTGEKKGGSLHIKTNEPAYVIGIISITPRLTYSQGNSWDMNLKTMNDLHKPALDGIGFQDLITDQMAFWDTDVEKPFKSVGKIPAWMNYMTDVDKSFGLFANENSEMFMTLNRRYEPNNNNKSIKDATTYIDPAKFNYIFADISRSSENFWVQISTDIIARRKISAKQIPNL